MLGQGKEGLSSMKPVCYITWTTWTALPQGFLELNPPVPAHSTRVLQEPEVGKKGGGRRRKVIFSLRRILLSFSMVGRVCRTWEQTTHSGPFFYFAATRLYCGPATCALQSLMEEKTPVGKRRSLFRPHLEAYQHVERVLLHPAAK